MSAKAEAPRDTLMTPRRRTELIKIGNILFSRGQQDTLENNGTGNYVENEKRT